MRPNAAMQAERPLHRAMRIEIAEMEELDRRKPDHFRGGDWCELQEEEEAVFEIDRDRWPAMVVAYEGYEIFKGLRDSGSLDRHPGALDQARADHPEWCAKASYGVEEFSNFAKEYAGLTHRESYAVYFKMQFSDSRCGLMLYRDEQETLDKKDV